MLFNSFTFPVFLAVVLAAYAALPHRGQNRLLLVASWVFYGWWDWRFLSLLLVSTVVDWWCGRAIAADPDPRRRRRWLLLSLCANLGILGFFKYCGFFVASFAELLRTCGVHASPPVLDIVLPVGISFYTFQTLSYVIDVYRGDTPPARDLETFALYVAWFPQLVAGPIERSGALLPRLQNPRPRPTLANFTAACPLLLVGYFKKVGIADAVAPYVEQAFADPGVTGGPTLLLSLYLFALQIYGDFSGYSDIARGTSRLFGIELCVNFRQPYLAASVTEFWRRWHVSLSAWLRDYLYVPLGGNRRGRLRTHANLMATMLLGGLWHGAAWTFVVWGALHGLYLVVHKALLGDRKPALDPRPAGIAATLLHAAKVLATFHLVCLAWIFFRADSVEAAFAYLAAIANNRWAPPSELVAVTIAYVTMTLLVDMPSWRHEREVPFDASAAGAAWRRGLAYAGMLLVVTLVGPADARPFLYFQF